jgi:hypothetical protein
MAAPNKYGVHNRLNLLEARCEALEQQNAELRTYLASELKNAVSDTVGQTGAAGRDGASIVGPVGPAGKDSTVPGPKGETGKRGDTGPRGPRGETGVQGIQGLPGKDGVSITGPAGPQGMPGDVLVIGDSEAAQAVIALRIRLKEQHAAIIAKLVESIEHAQGNKGGNWRHFQRLLESIRAEIEALR